ncbi:MAG TPA: Gfo/Idh/MocA family oxidoreductase [Candidatus Thermoplasmatota archaeon]|nr:Gfo/Idh/MocA family oxidoreductase [Candidatus Thermoplasmatota archaeon]
MSATRDGRPINVAIVGTGGIFRLAHGPAWKRLGRANVVATCDVLASRAEEAKATVGAREAFTDFGEMLKAVPEIEVVDICTPSDTHAEFSLRALKAGKHVICEKPMALTPADALRVQEAAREAGRHVLVGHTRRFDPRWLHLKDQLQSGRIGEAVSIRRTERSWGAFPAGDWHWDPNRSGGVLMDVGVHVADFFSWFMEDEPQDVFAEARSVRPEAKATGCNDFALVHIGFPGDRRGILEVSWAHPKEYAPFYSTTEILGTKGKLTLTDQGAAPMTIIRGGGGIEIPRYGPMLSAVPEAFEAELNHFLDCIEGLAEPRISPHQARLAVQVVAAAYESIKTGRTVRLGEVA